MNNQIAKIEYYICLFLYALKNKKINKNTYMMSYVIILEVTKKLIKILLLIRIWESIMFWN